MAETHDTIAEIIAEMRKISAEKYRLSSENGGAYGNPGVYHLDFAQFARVISDRLEEAHRRERGNAAKLREALKAAKKYLDGYTVNILELRRTVDAALAAPPRNCDRFGGDIDKLREVCARERGLNPEEDFPDVFPDWLLALSTEKEGGAK